MSDAPLVTGIDHLVLTVRDVEAAAAFYERVLGVQRIAFGAGRLAIRVGAQKINLQTLGQETRNHACIGSGDVCLTTDAPAQEIAARLRAQGVAVVEGPVERSGALGPITSVYFRDPDGNLIELAGYG